MICRQTAATWSALQRCWTDRAAWRTGQAGVRQGALGTTTGRCPDQLRRTAKWAPARRSTLLENRAL